MSKVRAVFLGTPEFAVTALNAVLADTHFELVGVVTQPDRPAGRKMQLTPSPVKSLALQRGLRVISPESVNKDLILAELQSWQAEVAIVVAFGQILSQKFLDLFPFGAVNLHGSLLPKWRGAAPIQRSVEAGDLETGVALQKIVKALDAGDVLGIRKCPIGPETTALELHDELAQLGCSLLHVELMDYVRGNLAPVPQDHSQVTYAKKIEKSESEIDWKQAAPVLHNKVRALTMGPGTFTSLDGKKIKIHRTRYSEGAKQTGKPGEILVSGSPQQMFVVCGVGSLQILELQPESRTRMKVEDFLKGRNFQPGAFLETLKSAAVAWPRGPLKEKWVAPSLLSSDFANLQSEIAKLEKAAADVLHVDVMDGRFVPNLTLGPPVVASIRKVTKMPLDVHLMIEEPEKLIPAFAEAGSDILTIHVESTKDPKKVLHQIRSLGIKTGITLRPRTELAAIENFLGDVDLVLVMTVEPGFGGQSFMMDQVEKMQKLKTWREAKGYKYLIEVDGGVSDATLKHCEAADILVAGSYIFKMDYELAVRKLKGKA